MVRVTSETRIVESLRDQVMPWVRSRGGLMRVAGVDCRGLVIFSEADGLTTEAQMVLKDAMEATNRAEAHVRKRPARNCLVTKQLSFSYISSVEVFPASLQY